jgi:hypothetical protein
MVVVALWFVKPLHAASASSCFENSPDTSWEKRSFFFFLSLSFSFDLY